MVWKLPPPTTHPTHPLALDLINHFNSRAFPYVCYDGKLSCTRVEATVVHLMRCFVVSPGGVCIRRIGHNLQVDETNLVKVKLAAATQQRGQLPCSSSSMHSVQRRVVPCGRSRTRPGRPVVPPTIPLLLGRRLLHRVDVNCLGRASTRQLRCRARKGTSLGL